MTSSTSGPFQANQQVSVWQRGDWRPGRVLSASSQAVTVRYRPGDQTGTAVDTVIPDKVRPRSDLDPLIDQSLSGTKPRPYSYPPAPELCAQQAGPARRGQTRARFTCGYGQRP